MDSRIREIEQWIEQAKTGLHDGGQEEYVRKLYLLDAEIRAVIKESGSLPGVNSSPERAGRGARRSATHFVTAGALAALLVLTALSAWFANPVLLSRLDRAGEGATDLALKADAAGTPPAQRVPAAIMGEEVVVAGWIDADPAGLDLLLAAADPASPAAAPADAVLDIGPVLANEHNPPPVILAAGGTEGGVAVQPAVYVGGAPVLLDFPAAPAESAPAAVDRFVAVDTVDNSNPQDAKDVDKLDPDALKQNVEKHFAR